MVYDKLAGAAPRILVLESQYWLDSACIAAAAGRGWEVASVPTIMEGRMSREMFKTFIERLTHFKPDFVLSVNMAGMDVGGMISGLFEDLCIPLVAWFVDDPRTILMNRTIYSNTFTVALTWEAGYQPYLQGLGFPHVYHLPLAADTSVFDSPPLEQSTLPPSFVGSAMIASANQTWEWIEKRPHLARVVLDAFDSGNVTRENFILGCEAMMGEEAVLGLDPDEWRHAEMFCFIEGTRRLRRDLVRRLLPEGLCVHGGSDWQIEFPDAKPPVHYREELPVLYRQSEINLNTTSIQMPTTVNQRVFDCPAAGGFLLTDAQMELGQLFDLNREVVAYQSLDECVELYRYYRTHPKERAAIAARARDRVLAEHTYAHRLDEIVGIIRCRFCG